jgi:hypothetical protein
LLHYFKDPKIINLQNKDIWLTQELTGAYSLWTKENGYFVRQYEISTDEPLCEIIDNFFFMLRKIEIIDSTRGTPLELEVIK